MRAQSRTEDLPLQASRTVYVGNLAAGTNEASLRSIFQNCGPVSLVRIAGKPNFNTCFAFVEFSEPSHADLATNAMDGLDLGSRKIKVSIAKISSLIKHQEKLEKEAKKAGPPSIQAQVQARIAAVTGGQLPIQQDNFSQQELISAGGPSQLYYQPQYIQASQSQPLLHPSVHPSSHPLPLHYYAPQPQQPLSGPMIPQTSPLTLYQTQPPIQITYQSVPQTNIRPRPNGLHQRAVRPRQNPNRVERTVFVENVASSLDEQALADHFEVCGEVTAVRIVGHDAHIRKAWIEFKESSQAKSAKDYDHTTLGPNKIRVKPSKTAIHTNGLPRLSRGRRRSRSPRRERTSTPDSKMRSETSAPSENANSAMQEDII